MDSPARADNLLERGWATPIPDEDGPVRLATETPPGPLTEAYTTTVAPIGGHEARHSTFDPT